MNLRNKLLLVFVALAFAPLALVSVINYRSGLSAVEGLLRARADESAARITRRIERTLETREARLLELARADSLREYVRDSQPAQTGGARQAGGPQAAGGAARGIPDEVQAHFGTYFRNNREYLESVTCLDSSGGPLFRVPDARAASGDEASFQTSDFVSSDARYDSRVWSLTRAEALRSPVTEESCGAARRVTVPVFAPTEGPAVGAVVAVFRLKGVIEDAAETEAPASADAARVGASSPGDAAAASAQTNARPVVVALDNATGTVVYHTNGAFTHQSFAAALPYFAGVAARMKSSASGADFYDEPGGDRRLAAFRQVDALNLSLAVAEDYTSASGPVRRSGLFGVLLALAAGLAALALLLAVARRATHDIERVARGAAAIAAGDFDHRIEVSASSETQDLAESLNLMTERLRGLIAKEAESRQFQSFLRISAMISHDLKNAIAGLSMLVANMERQFHREEFRADAIESLREATEKLKRTVARLSEPAKSLSGEYRMAARETDLVPIMRRVLATIAEPSRPLYEVEARLPDTLVATVEPGRIENVFENLVINALEAMGAVGGRLTVEAGALEGGLVFFSVADTGIGMSEEFVRERLYRPFSTTKTKGIGLGLFTCREVVEAHGGRLEVESRTGVGTRFRVVLPSRLFKSGERRAQPEKAAAAVEASEPRASA